MSYISKVTKKIHKLKKLLYFKTKEKVFRDECNIKYFLEKHESSNKLIISFAGLQNKNMPARYQYTRTLEKQRENKLFILDDFGPSISGGSWYLAQNNDFKIERSVEKLIHNVMSDLKVSKENVITIGSSKGGFAAIYYAMKYHYGTAIVGEPQIYLGDYLNQPGHELYLNYIMGNNSNENINCFNSLIMDTIKENNKKTKNYLLCGENGNYHKHEIPPYIKELKRFDVPYSLELGQFSHNGIGPYYSEFLLKILNNIKAQENKDEIIHNYNK